jgi:hypothetical protein
VTSADPSGQSWNTPADALPTPENPPPPAVPPQPPAAPPPPPSPPSAADPFPDVPPAASAPPVIGVSLRVSRRLLWVGDAYYPLHNIARVHTLTIHPRRKEAVLLFVRRLLITAAVATLLGLLAGLIDTSGSDGSAGLTVLVVIIALATLVYYVTEMLKVLGAPSHYVLAVETSGPSTAVVTTPDREHLRRLAQQIADAIENPKAEFEVRVDTINVSPKHYYFGDNVNMYGGTGNVGMAS